MKKSFSFYTIKSRLFPLSPLVKRIEFLIEKLPRVRYKIVLKPFYEIAVLNERKKQYKSLGKSPRFELHSSDDYLVGWYYFETALTNNNGNRDANLYCMNGDGIEHTIPIPSNLRGSVREVIFIPKGTVALFWSPTASFGYFSQSGILVHKITWFESYVRRLFRIIFDYQHFKDHSTILSVIFEVFFDVQKGYLRTADIRINRLMGNDYEAFIRKHDNLSKKQLNALVKEIESWKEMPLLSLVYHVSGDNFLLFKATLHSILQQYYSHWELFIEIDTLSMESDVVSRIRDITKWDNRIRLYEATFFEANAFLDTCQGSHVLYVEEYDRLHPKALYRVAQVLLKQPEAKIIYSDSDFIDTLGTRSDPCFKPDWNVELLCSGDYIGNMCFYDVNTIRKMGGIRNDFIGAQYYDLTLRMINVIDQKEIVHIPKVLYHQYRISDTTKTGRISSHWMGKKALQSFFDTTEVQILDGITETFYRIVYPLPTNSPLVTIIIPTRDRVDILKMCIESIIKYTSYPRWEIIVVDNGSVEPQTHSYFKEISCDSRIHVYQYDKPFNYAALNNFALLYAKGELLTLLNNDIEILSEGWLSELVSHALRSEVGVVGAKLLYPDGVVQHAGVFIGIGGVAGHGHKYIKDDDVGYCHRAVLVQNVSAVTGACLCVRRDIYEAVGGLDENLAVAFNDIDFCLKVRDLGYNNVYTPYSKLIHHESISRGHDDTSKKYALFLKEFDYMKNRWGDKLKNDPAYNPNLTHDFENFGWRD